jgi:quercetin dioxygenase-like cupin family protein
VLYEDQGERIRLHAGDCVNQPPGIRHRVCEASADIEVIEIGVPADHVTSIDHAMTLPNGVGDPDREWDGQKFVHHLREGATWAPARISGFSARDAGMSAGTRGVAGVQVMRKDTGAGTAWTHDADILFTFVMDGTMRLHAEGQEARDLEAGDAFVIPPGMVVSYSDISNDLEILEVALRGDFTTSMQR